MAFNLSFVMHSVEFRRQRYGVSSNTGKAWMSLVFEDSEGYQVECSVPADMQQDMLDEPLEKGDLCNVALRAVAKADGSSYVQLRSLPELCEVDE